MFEILANIGFLILKCFVNYLELPESYRQHVYILQTITVSPLSHILNINFSLAISDV